MPANPQRDVTLMLEAVQAGRDGAAERLLEAVYDELRALARARMRRERPDLTLEPTALVHEAYLRLVGDPEAQWANRRHFFAAAAEAMRRILIERARRHARLKRGGGRERLSLNDNDTLAPAAAEAVDLLALDEALERLEQMDPRMGQVVKLRFFAGLTIEQTAEALGLSVPTVNRDWLSARTWLARELNRAGESA